MPISPDDFDPLATVIDWLDMCRAGEINALLALYDDRATIDCDCESVSLAGRSAIAAYWRAKLETRVIPAFTLDDITLDGEGVRVDYRSDEGKPVWMCFRFNEAGKIRHTSCGPIGCSKSAA
ncbi:MAG: nuclear transport factor 2 family protein [Rhizobiales bacterium]|nr:nuclear transport factor 2 family protein [Hyphomicrobiales bacterium]